MTKSFFYTIAILMTLCVSASCRKESGGETAKDRISLSEQKLYFESGQDQTLAVSVECEGDWTIEGFSEGMKGWMDIDALSGRGKAVVNLTTVEFNPYDRKRMAVLNFVSGKASCALEITQFADPERSIDLSDDSLAFGGQLETKTLTVHTAKNWWLDTDAAAIPSWLKVSPESAAEGQVVNISTVQVNEEIGTRTCTLDFRIDREHAASLTVSQAPGIELKIDTDALDFAAAGPESKQLKVSCNSPTKEWTVEGYTAEVREWLNLDVTGGIGDKTLTFSTVGINADLTKIANMQIRLDAARYLDFTVTQASGLQISVDPAQLAFDGNKADTKTAIVTTNTDKYEWEIQGYTSEVQEWLDIDIVKASGYSQTITVSTLGANTSGSVRTAELNIKLSEGVEASLSITQDKKIAGTKVISWTGKSDVQTVTAPSGKDYNYLPYTTGTDPSKNPEWTDGPDGPKAFTGYFQATREYIFQMDSQANVGSSYTMVIGTCSEETKTFFGNLQLHKYSGIRTRCSYVKTPAISGYKLTGIKVICGNAADKASSVTIGTDTSIKVATTATAANVLEGKAQLTLGKPTPVDLSFTTTAVNTSYYVFVLQDRLITGLTFTYTEVE